MGPSRQQARFQRRVLILIFIAILCAIWDKAVGHQRLQQWVEPLTVSVWQTMSWPAQQWHKLSLHWQAIEQVSHENSALNAQIQILNAQLHRLKAMQHENIQLRKLLSSSSEVGGDFVVGELLASINVPGVAEIVVNRGRLQGIYLGQPVLDGLGVFGQVIAVYERMSKVQLIVDRRTAIPVQVQSTGMRAIAIGTGQLNTLRLIEIPDATTLKPGDVLITSGLGLQFPIGYPVGVVETVQHHTAHDTWTVILRSSAQFSTSRQFLFVWPAHARWADEARQVVVQASVRSSRQAVDLDRLVRMEP